MRGVLAAAAVMLVAATAAAQPIRIQRDRRDPRWLHGSVTVRADMAAAWDLLRDVRRWPAVYGDIQHVRVVGRTGGSMRVLVDSDADEDPLLYEVRIDDAHRRVETVLRDEPTRVRTRIVVAPGDVPGTVMVRHSLFIELTGIAAIVATDDQVHREQRRILTAHLRDIGRALSSLLPSG